MRMIACLVGSLALASVACGQCPDWLAFDTTPPEMRNVATALDLWDRDGAGPLEPVLVAGGTGVGRQTNVSTWDGEAWVSLGGWDAGFLEVYDFAVFGGQLHAAAGYNIQGGTPLDTIRAWDGAAWQALDGGLDATWGYAYAYAAGAYEGALVVGGFFNRAGNLAAHRIATWNGSEWGTLGSGINSTNDGGFVNDLVVYRGELVAGGLFQRAGGGTASNIAAWNGASWRSLSSGISGGQDRVWEMIEYDGDLIVVGAFFNAGGVATRGIARWNGSSWSGVGGDGVSGGANGAVYSVAVHDGDLIIGGSFAEVGGVAATNVARWDGAQWHAMDEGRPYHVFEMHPFGNDLIVSELDWSAWGCACAADVDGNGVVDFDDLLRVLDAWGNKGGPEDLDGSGTVDFGDLLIVLDSWGPCS